MAYQKELLPAQARKQVTKIVRQYKLTYLEIIKELKGIPTDFTRDRLQKKMGLISKELSKLDKKTKKWVLRETPKAYQSGVKRAMKGFEKQGMDYDLGTAFTNLDKESVKAATQETYQDFGNAITTVKRMSRHSMNEALKDQLQARIGVGLAGGETRREVSKQIEKEIEKRGITGLVDRGGKNWELDNYAEMLARTKIMEADRMGTVNRMGEEGYELVRISTHNTDCELCKPWEGKILSIKENGEYPSVGNARDSGLFHPNCGHVITPYHFK